MAGVDAAPGEPLPAPATAILTFVVLGWALERRYLGATGRPYVPDCNLWLGDLFAQAEGMGWQSLGRKAQLGLAAAGGSRIELLAIDAAFEEPGFQDRLIQALRRYRDGSTTYRFSPAPFRRPAGVAAEPQPAPRPALPAKTVSGPVYGPAGASAFRLPRPR